MMLPIAGSFAEDAGQIGFGSEIYQDRQRGDLIIMLDNASGPELVTRAVTALAGPLSSQHGIVTPFGYRSDLIVVMADIPDDPAITEGPHGLYIVRRLGGVDYPGPSYAGVIRVLPASVPIAGGSTVVGESTPFLIEVGLDATGMIKNAVPDPQVVVMATVATYASEFEVTFPSSQIGIQDVTEAIVSSQGGYGAPPFPGTSISHRATTWWKTVSPGVLAVGMVSPDRPLRGVSIVFTLKAAATQPLAPTAGSIQNARSYDASGNLITAGWSAPWIR
ncbi:MAG: hypothetical protein NTZ61_15145 [Proteobacteria bacterium]|nr:hypothetical protein [Pseudomonadota bacterium]